MKIIIPMSGFGQRFINAGYTLPKPLIEIENKPIIHHVIDLFPGNNDFIFICNKDHLEETNMEQIIKSYCPKGEIVGIGSHKKGPVYAVSEILNSIDDEEEVIINYCDFTCDWDFVLYLEWINQGNYDGSIPSYKGFHPHSLGTTNYAYIKEKNGILEEIKEKEPYTNNRMMEYASSGTYHFKKGIYVKNYFRNLMKMDINLNGEFYCSLVYNLMVRDGLKIGIYEIDHFMQWGTPEDVSEYNYHSSIFNSLATKENSMDEMNGTTIISMAGKGERFKKEGYELPKPLITVNKSPIFIRAANSLPKTDKYVFIVKNEIKDIVKKQLKVNKIFKSYEVLSLEGNTDGQAVTAAEGIKLALKNKPITISACDHALVYNSQKLLNILNQTNYDLIVWTKSKHWNALKNPNMYGWVSVEKERVKNVSVKKLLNSAEEDSILIGTFTFRNLDIYMRCYERMLNRKGLVNNEYYIDTMIEDALFLGYNCIDMKVDQFICWGTPNELKTYEYWEKCFSGWSSHPYQGN